MELELRGRRAAACRIPRRARDLRRRRRRRGRRSSCQFRLPTAADLERGGDSSPRGDPERAPPSCWSDASSRAPRDASWSPSSGLAPDVREPIRPRWPSATRRPRSSSTSPAPRAGPLSRSCSTRRRSSSRSSMRARRGFAGGACARTPLPLERARDPRHGADTPCAIPRAACRPVPRAERPRTRRMSDYLVNLARRCAGLASRRASARPGPSSVRSRASAARSTDRRRRRPRTRRARPDRRPAAVRRRRRCAHRRVRRRVPERAAADARDPIAPHAGVRAVRARARRSSRARASDRPDAAADIRARGRGSRPPVRASRTASLPQPASTGTEPSRDGSPVRSGDRIAAVQRRARRRALGRSSRPSTRGSKARPRRSRPVEPANARTAARPLAPTLPRTGAHAGHGRRSVGADRGSPPGREVHVRIGDDRDPRRAGDARADAAPAVAPPAAAPRRPRADLTIRPHCAATRRGSVERRERLPRDRRRQRDAPDAALRPDGAARRRARCP